MLSLWSKHMASGRLNLWCVKSATRCKEKSKSSCSNATVQLAAKPGGCPGLKASKAGEEEHLHTVRLAAISSVDPEGGPEQSLATGSSQAGAQQLPLSLAYKIAQALWGSTTRPPTAQKPPAPKKKLVDTHCQCTFKALQPQLHCSYVGNKDLHARNFQKR